MQWESSPSKIGLSSKSMPPDFSDLIDKSIIHFCAASDGLPFFYHCYFSTTVWTAWIAFSYHDSKDFGLFSDPIFALTFLVSSWVPNLLDALFQTSFCAALLLFWICTYHGLRTVTPSVYTKLVAGRFNIFLVIGQQESVFVLCAQTAACGYRLGFGFLLLLLGKLPQNRGSYLFYRLRFQKLQCQHLSLSLSLSVLQPGRLWIHFKSALFRRWGSSSLWPWLSTCSTCCFSLSEPGRSWRHCPILVNSSHVIPFRSSRLRLPCFHLLQTWGSNSSLFSPASSSLLG